jgi:DNA integrity scanning protein DisA with diadenylate cyclase activity
MTKKLVNVEYGARHRAAMGICEQFDCFSFVVSETSGAITFFHGNNMKKLANTSELLYKQINEILENHFDSNKKRPVFNDSDVPKKLIRTSNEKTK